MDGIPAEVRDELNRDHLDEVLPRVKEQYGDDSAEYRELKKLKNETLDAEGTERYLLALDTTDGKGRAILADGNPDTADNVATLVPGTGIKWQAINGQLGRAEVIKKEAQEVDPDATHAVISWIGYNTPDDAEAISEDYAVAASQGLRDFQIGLRSTHEGKPSNNTIIGHSYGSTLAGHAMQGTGLDADNYVFVGSPGLNAEHVSDLGVPGSKVHVSTAKNDTINAFTPDFVHGADPTSEDFGASVFDSADGSMLGKFPFGQAHSDYFKRNSKSARHMGEIVAGQH
nr:alpha/beta hydrolase [Nocardiopsis mwathae]